jgi:hypothetical protein
VVGQRDLVAGRADFGAKPDLLGSQPLNSRRGSPPSRRKFRGRSLTEEERPTSQKPIWTPRNEEYYLNEGKCSLSVTKCHLEPFVTSTVGNERPRKPDPKSLDPERKRGLFYNGWKTKNV